jgi:hypothetical protein
MTKVNICKAEPQTQKKPIEKQNVEKQNEW